MESFEEELGASQTCIVNEVWFVYVVTPKTRDPRAPGRIVIFSSNNQETGIFAVPIGKSKDKVQHRCEFNACGEASTSANTYTAIPARRFCELPRMEHGTKVGILGATAAGVAGGRRVQKDIEERGHPSSWAGTKTPPPSGSACLSITM